MADSVAVTGQQIVTAGSGAQIQAAAGYFHTQQAPITMLASAVQAASGAGADVVSDYIKNADALAIVLNNTAVNTPTSLDVAIQAKFGSLYYNLARFTRVGAGPTAIEMVTLQRNMPQTANLSVVPAADPAVGNGLLVVPGMGWLDTLRVKFAIVGTSYTFSVVAYPLN